MAGPWAPGPSGLRGHPAVLSADLAFLWRVHPLHLTFEKQGSILETGKEPRSRIVVFGRGQLVTGAQGGRTGNRPEVGQMTENF